VIIGLIIIFIVYLSVPINIAYTTYLMDTTHKISYSEMPSGQWYEKKCPNGDKLERIEIIVTKDSDTTWRHAYKCDADKIFWVAEFRDGPPNEYGSHIDYYGPFEGDLVKRVFLQP